MKISKPDDAERSGIHDPADLPKGLTTAEILTFLRKKSGYTLAEIGVIIHTSEGTLKGWASGRHCPPESRRLNLIRIFCAPDVPPSSRSRLAAHRAHGLTWDASKRKWKLRLTIDMGKKVVGKRIGQSMHTSDLEIAIEKRNAIVEAYQKLGLTVRISLQRRGHLATKNTPRTFSKSVTTK